MVSSATSCSIKFRDDLKDKYETIDNDFDIQITKENSHSDLRIIPTPPQTLL